MNTLLTGVFGVVLVAILVVIFFVAIIGFAITRTWIKVAKSSEALIVSGKKSRDADDTAPTTVIIGGKTIVNPISQRFDIISLRSRQVMMTAVAQSKNAVTLSVEAVALVKIGATPELVRAAAERFSDQDEAVEKFTQDQLEGALRGIIAQQDVVDLMQNRQAFAEQIAQNIAPELRSQGLVLDSFQIKGITDSDGYIQSLGAPEIENRRREAEIARADAEREIQKKNTAVDELNLTESRALEINRAEADQAVKTAQAEAEQAESLVRAQRHQEVLQQQAKNRRDELEAEVNAQADAEKYEAQTRADAEAYTRDKNAEAQAMEEKRRADSRRDVAEAEAAARKTAAEAAAHEQTVAAKAKADAQRAEDLAAAEGIEARANAEAEAERKIGLARAEALRAEAEAMQENQQAVLVSKIIEVMPEMVRESATALGSIGNITIYGGGSDTAESVSSIGGQPMSNVAGMLAQTEDLFGVNIGDLIAGRAKGEAFGQGLASATTRSGGQPSILSEASSDADNGEI